MVGLAFVAMLAMETPGIDTTESWRPEWRIMALYGIYFAIGWLAYGVPGLVADLERWCWLRLGAGIALLAGATVSTIACYAVMFDPAQGVDTQAYRWIFAVTQLLQAATACLLLLGLAWIYLLHLPLTIFVPALFRRWETPGLLKMVSMMVLVTIPLLVTYHLLARGTAIGATLCGRTYPVWPFTRTRAPEPPPTE
jgi:hypothetical protein